MTEQFSVKHRGITIKITRRKSVYQDYEVRDYTSGRLKRHVRARLEDAKSLAWNLCEAMANGQQQSIKLLPHTAEVGRALDITRDLGLRIDHAVELLGTAARVLGGNPNDLLAAAQYWREHRPDKPFTPLSVTVAAAEYLKARNGKVSVRRHAAMTSTLKAFAAQFGDRKLHLITTKDLRLFLDAKGWLPKTVCDVLSTLGLVYREAALMEWVPKGCNPTLGIARPKVRGGVIGIFTPAEARQIMEGVKDELKPALALNASMSCKLP